MRLLLLVAVNLHTVLVSSRKHDSDSDESIENLLYYKDCNHKPKESSPAPNLRSEIQPTPVRKPDPCPFPKMCCSMSCGDDCGSQQSYLSRQMEPLQQNLQPIQPISRQSSLPAQPQIMRGRKKKIKPTMEEMGLQLPFGARKSLGFTKEKIKSLISQDADIRKILKDLVRVTMQKVDLLEMVKARRSNAGRNSETSLNSDDYDSYRQVQ
ncbi:uncharacterized protein LOC114362932 [Ostrinia furnacalis]|uniref:uncharacterized protein LOC114362932 n=1 Tax=Ostrinia furnacalis TaxID=93504 RepID=UPI00103B6C6E|nr:uncharacterized protein LOC114362932 [Ostrinia furnacalis]